MIYYEIVDTEKFYANIVSINTSRLKYVGDRGFRGPIGLETSEDIEMEYKYGDYLPDRFVKDYGFRLITLEEE